MASGSTGGRGGKGFDFGSDDILCSYEDYGSHKHGLDPSNGSPNHSDPSKDFHKSRIARSSAFQSGSYGMPEDPINQEIVAAVDRSMKTHFDNLMRFLEGVSSRLSQLELYCYNLDKSIGEMKSDILRDHRDAETKLKSLEKHMQEVHRSVQILRDKQELADTQKELAKLQLIQKESPAPYEEKAKAPAAEVKKADQQPEMAGQQLALALALPQQVAPQAQQQPAPVAPPQIQNQPIPAQQAYYPAPQIQNTQPPAHYVQQWQQPQAAQAMARPPPPSTPSSTVYSPYIPSEPVPNTGYTGIPNPYAYGSARPVMPQQVKNAYVTQQGDGYGGGAYVIYEGEGGRHNTPGMYPAGNAGAYPRNSRYSEVIEKMVNMGFRGENVVAVIQRLEESGQPVDFHSILDRLNVHSTPGPQRPWSG